jgi:predicted nucleic acid-binding protein
MSSTSSEELTFVDTNVLVYAHDTAEPDKNRIARTLVDELWRSRRGVLSTQVLQEFYVVATRRLDPPISRPEARELVSLYGRWKLVQVDSTLIVAASHLEEAHTISFWDALIVEAARVGGAVRLVTEDLQHGRRFGGLRVENPFRPPEDAADGASDAGVTLKQPGPGDGWLLETRQGIAVRLLATQPLPVEAIEGVEPVGNGVSGIVAAHRDAQRFLAVLVGCHPEETYEVRLMVAVQGSPVVELVIPQLVPVLHADPLIRTDRSPAFEQLQIHVP